eukprot:3852966-Rhodomonas_salina.3
MNFVYSPRRCHSARIAKVTPTPATAATATELRVIMRRCGLCQAAGCGSKSKGSPVLRKS